MLDLAGTSIEVGKYVAYKQPSTEVLSIGKIEKVDKTECVLRTLDISIINSKPVIRRQRIHFKNLVVVPPPSLLIQDFLSGTYNFDDETARLARDWLNTGKFPFEDTKQEYHRENY